MFGPTRRRQAKTRVRSQIAQSVRLVLNRFQLLAQTGVFAFAARIPRPRDVTPLRRKVVDLSFEVEKVTRQRTAQLEASSTQFCECALGDALACRVAVD